MRARKPFLRRGRSKLAGSSEGFVSEFPYGVVGLADQLAGEIAKHARLDPSRSEDST
jgi:hypothetical protein